MKKIIALVLALMLVIAVVACGSKDDNKTTDPAASTTDTPAESTTDTTPVNPTASLKEIVNAIVSCDAVSEMSLVTEEMNEGYFSGFKEEIKGFEEALRFGPMIGTIPFVGYVFKISDAAEASAFLENLKSAANPRWNICTEADTTITAVKGNIIFFCMHSLGDDASAQLISAFEEAAK